MTASMKWRMIPKNLAATKPTPPGTYRDWKPALAVEAEHQCVYCAIPDARLGGIYTFHVEHFEPKSKAPARINDWSNLYYACPICNVFKGNDWPMPGSSTAYLDPSKVNYETIFQRVQGGTIVGQSVAARYMVERLYLNRPQLRLERREAELRERLKQTRLEIQALLGMLTAALDEAATLQVAECLRIKCRIDELIEMLWTVSPYESVDVRRGGR